MCNNNELCKCGKVGKISCPNDERCGNYNQLPADIEGQISNEIESATENMDVNTSFQNGYYSGYKSGYEAGATAWAIWKLRYDELKAQSAVWVKATKFKYEVGVAYHAKDFESKGAGHFDETGCFMWGDASITPPGAQDDLLILDESGATDWKEKIEQEVEAALHAERNRLQAKFTENDIRWAKEHAALKEELREKTNSLKSIRYSLDNRDAECKALKERADMMGAEHADLNIALAAMLNGYQSLSQYQKDWFTVPKDLIDAYTKMVLEYDAPKVEALAWKGGKEESNE